MTSRRRPPMPSIARDATREITAISWAVARRTGRAPARAAMRLAHALRGHGDDWTHASHYA